jgi:hypothetical protein
MERARFYTSHRFHIYDLYLTKNLTLKRVKGQLEQEHAGAIRPSSLAIDYPQSFHNSTNLMKSINQWITILRRLGIDKNLCRTEVIRVEAILSSAPGIWCWLVLANGVLLNNKEIIRHYRRIKKSSKSAPRRTITLLKLPFNFEALSDPAIFRDFHKLLFSTKVHFESSFNECRWEPNERGLYGRTPKLREELSELSLLHNKIYAALKELKAGRDDRGWALIRTTDSLHDSVVRSGHHRQIPDILAIMVLVLRNGYKELQKQMVMAIYKRAQRLLADNDPRRIMFECLTKLKQDQICHVFVAYDLFCRQLWLSKAGNNTVKAHFSYNLASFPRADAGEFYSLFKQKSLADIQIMLSCIDEDLGQHSHETVIIWHTAIHFLFNNHRYLEMSQISQSLRDRLDQHGAGLDYTQHRQLNLDASLTSFLFGRSQNALGYPFNARMAFNHAVNLRNLVLPDNTWDAAKGAALDQLVALDERLGNVRGAIQGTGLIDTMYSRLRWSCSGRSSPIRQCPRENTAWKAYVSYCVLCLCWGDALPVH